MHLAQAKIRLPRKGIAFLGDFASGGITTHWRLGYFFCLVVGLYFPRSFFRFWIITDPFPQIVHRFAISLF